MLIGEQYKVLAELGAGGMGIVYYAIEAEVDREVAVKKLRSEFSRSTDFAERFRKEARIQARLKHANLAHLYRFFKEGDSFYIAMEFVEGSPLSRLIPLSWQHAVSIFVRVVDALEYAHSQGVLHRDIKPDNIMVGPHGEVKVMDFGIAHVLGSARQTRDKSIVGTLEYMPPEQIEGKEISARSDIYSLGALLFEMISGQLPFRTESEFELLKCHLEAPPPKLSSVIPGLPAFLDAAIEKAMAKKPADRFVSCRAFETFLKQAAPDVCSASLDSFPRKIQTEEVDRFQQRIEALLNGGQFDLALQIAARAAVDYPGNESIARAQTRVKEALESRSVVSQHSEKTAFLKEIFGKLTEMEKSGAKGAAAALAKTALEKYPEVPALRVAQALLADV